MSDTHSDEAWAEELLDNIPGDWEVYYNARDEAKAAILARLAECHCLYCYHHREQRIIEEWKSRGEKEQG